MEFNSILSFFFMINSIHHFFSKFSSLCSHPLFSTIVALYTIILLYAPSFFLTIVLSPIINSTGIILLSLLRLGANEKLEKESDYLEPRVIDHKDNHYERLSNDRDNLTLDSSLVLESSFMEQTHVEFNTEMDLGLESNQTFAKSDQMSINFEHDYGLESNFQDDYHKREFPDTNSMESSHVIDQEGMELESKQVDTTKKFVEWNMKGPLEVIYEAYEGEEEDDEENNENNMVSSDNHIVGRDKYPSLSTYYPDSETDSSSDGDFPMNKSWESHESVFFRWEEDEDDREELIEISLDHYGQKSIEFSQEEDNLIEIDIFPTRN